MTDSRDPYKKTRVTIDGGPRNVGIGGSGYICELTKEFKDCNVFRCPFDEWPQLFLKVPRMTVTLTFRQDCETRTKGGGFELIEADEGNHVLYSLSKFLSSRHSLKCLTIRWRDETLEGVIGEGGAAKFLYPLLAVCNTADRNKKTVEQTADKTTKKETEQQNTLRLWGLHPKSSEALQQELKVFKPCRSQNALERYLGLDDEYYNLASLIEKFEERVDQAHEDLAEYGGTLWEAFAKGFESLEDLLKAPVIVGRREDELIEEALNRFPVLLDATSVAFVPFYIKASTIDLQNAIDSMQDYRAGRAQAPEEDRNVWGVVDDVRERFGDNAEEWESDEVEMDGGSMAKLLVDYKGAGGTS